MYSNNMKGNEKTVNELAMEYGIEKCNFDEIFRLKYSTVEKVEIFSEKGICTNVEQLRENLEYAGKRCAIYVGLIELFEDEIGKFKHNINNHVYDDEAEKWVVIIQIHRDVYEMMGYLTLLQMDALTTCISLLQAKNDTEKIVLCKHTYTILYEAKQHDLFKKVSAGMQKYPESLVKKNELNSFWKNIKDILTTMINIDEAKEIRNKLDAHKDDSFSSQIALFKKCDWALSVVNLSVFIILIDKIQLYMHVIHQNVNVLCDQYYSYMKERVKRYDEMLNQLQGYNESLSC